MSKFTRRKAASQAVRIVAPGSLRVIECLPGGFLCSIKGHPKRRGCHEFATRIDEPRPEADLSMHRGNVMLLDAIALVILLGLMLVPLVNIIVGVTVGAGFAGPPGAVCGALIAFAITGAQKLIGDWRGWFTIERAPT